MAKTQVTFCSCQPGSCSCQLGGSRGSPVGRNDIAEQLLAAD